MRKFAFIFAVGFGLLGCSKSTAPTGSASTSSAEKPAASDSRKPLPEFEIAKLDGGSVKSADLKGKVTVLDFWATWCDPCKAEVPDYNALLEKYAGKDFQILGVTMESGTADEIKQKAAELKIKYPLALGDDKIVDAFGGMLGFPTTFLVTKDGKIQKKFLGEIPGKQKQLVDGIDALLNATPASSAPAPKPNGSVTQVERPKSEGNE
jgi:thiol-disulfide isomerase/thioredoxin